MRSIACRRCQFFVEFDEPYCPNCGTIAPCNRWLRIRDLITDHLCKEAAVELTDEHIRAAVAATSLGHGLLWVAAHRSLGLPWPLWLLGLAPIPVLSWLASKYRLSVIGYFSAMFAGMVCLFSGSGNAFATLWTMGAPVVGWAGGALGALAKRHLQKSTRESRATLAGRERALRALLPALQTSDDLCREAIATLPRGGGRGDGFRLLQQQRARVRAELRLRHSQLQLIDVARWMSKFEPILSELEALDAEVEEARDGRRRVVGVQRREDQVTGHRRLDGGGRPLRRRGVEGGWNYRAPLPIPWVVSVR